MIIINIGKRVGKIRLLSNLFNSKCRNKELQQKFDQEILKKGKEKNE